MNIDLIKRWINKYNPDHVFVAYSGGLDSTALLYLVNKLCSNVTALHVDHGISANSKLWLEHCRLQSKNWGNAFYSISLTPIKSNLSLEQWARFERYKFFKAKIFTRPNSLIMTAHHLQDQAETFLLQSLRGGGLEGLSGIAFKKSFASGVLIRPFLYQDRNNIVHFCEKEGLIYLEDESNVDRGHLRNYIRLEVMSGLKADFSGIFKTLVRSSVNCYEAQQVLYNYLIKDLKILMGEDNSIDLNKLSTLDYLIQKHVLKLWLNKIIIVNVNSTQLQQIHEGVNKSKTNWQYKLSNTTLIIYRNRLFFNDFSRINNTISNSDIFTWLNSQNIISTLNFAVLLIRNRRVDDRCRYPGRVLNQKLKIIFQELGIQIKDRANIRIVCLKVTPKLIVAIYPFFICPDFLQVVI